MRVFVPSQIGALQCSCKADFGLSSRASCGFRIQLQLVPLPPETDCPHLSAPPPQKSRRCAPLMASPTPRG